MCYMYVFNTVITGHHKAPGSAACRARAQTRRRQTESYPQQPAASPPPSIATSVPNRPPPSHFHKAYSRRASFRCGLPSVAEFRGGRPCSAARTAGSEEPEGTGNDLYYRIRATVDSSEVDRYFRLTAITSAHYLWLLQQLFAVEILSNSRPDGWPKFSSPA
jgi:hypothetical protein